MKSRPKRHPVVYALLVACLGILMPLRGQADIYSWTDANGVRHFTNQPPQSDASVTRQRAEIPYDAAADRKNQAADDRYFDQRALKNTLRKLAQTERALAESLERAQAAERRADNRMPAYEYEYDYPDYWGSYGGGDYYDDAYNRRGGADRYRRNGRQRGRMKNRQDHRPKTNPPSADKGRHIAEKLPEWKIKQHRFRRNRLSKRERGVTSGLTRVVRAVPSPYYMGYRPVYSRDTSYRSRRDGGRHHGRRGSGGGARRSGARARASF